jgi:diguanylate cyclase (GGDEF)-like protein
MQLEGLAGVISQHQVNRLSALLWSIGALMGLLGVLLPHGPGVRVSGWIALTVLAAVVAAGSWWLGTELSIAFQYILSVVALVVIGFALLCVHQAPAIYIISSLYVLATIYTAAFYESRAFALYLVLQAASSGWILFTSGLPAAPAAWAVTVGTTTTVGVVVHLLREALARAATTDHLTGLVNRRAFVPVLARAHDQCRRTGRPLCLAFVDLDDFKAINDAQGHHAGDTVLVDVTKAWRRQLRKGDVLARAGGDEFILLLPDATVDEATDVLTRMRSAVSQSFSVGLVPVASDDGVEEALLAADRCCYTAKAAGGGQLVSPQAVPTRPVLPSPSAKAS